jgi:hypothetical protein
MFYLKTETNPVPETLFLNKKQDDVLREKKTTDNVQKNDCTVLNFLYILYGTR